MINYHNVHSIDKTLSLFTSSLFKASSITFNWELDIDGFNVAIKSSKKILAGLY